MPLGHATTDIVVNQLLALSTELHALLDVCYLLIIEARYGWSLVNSTRIPNFKADDWPGPMNNGGGYNNGPFSFDSLRIIDPRMFPGCLSLYII